MSCMWNFLDLYLIVILLLFAFLRIILSMIFRCKICFC